MQGGIFQMYPPEENLRSGYLQQNFRLFHLKDKKEQQFDFVAVIESLGTLAKVRNFQTWMSEKGGAEPWMANLPRFRPYFIVNPQCA